MSIRTFNKYTDEESVTPTAGYGRQPIYKYKIHVFYINKMFATFNANSLFPAPVTPH